MDFEKAAKYSLCAAILSPVVVFMPAVFPFITGKLFFFRLAVTAAIICALLNWIFGKTDKRPKIKTPIVIAVAVFAIVYVVACFIGINPAFSFWSNFERGEGGFQMIYYALFFFLCVWHFRDERDWEKAALVSLAAAVGCIVYGLLASTGIPKTIGPGIFNRFFGSLGNADYLGTFMFFPLFYAGWLLFKKKSERIKKPTLWILLVVFLVFMLLSQTRGSFVGFGAGIFAGLIYLFLKIPKWRKAIGSGITVLIILSGVIFTFGKSVKIPFCPTCNRLVSFSIADFNRLPRVWAWESAIKGWKDRPILGWGPENYSAVFDRYFDSRHFIPGVASETWFDRAHSVYFDYLVQTGILGLLAYLGIFAAVFTTVFKAKGGQGSEREKALILALLVAYLAQGAFLFEVLPIYLNLFLFSAFLNFFFSKTAGKKEETNNV